MYQTRKSLCDIALLAELAVALIGLVVVIISSEYRLIGLIIFAAMILVSVFQVFVILSYKVKVENSRLKIKRGIISTTREEIDLSHIASVKIHQGFLGKIVGYGDITLDIIGRSPLLLPQIKSCNKLKEILENKMK